MELLDTNVLVHAAYMGSPLHSPATALVQRALTQQGRYCIAPQILVEFAAVVTRKRFVDPPLGPIDLQRMCGRLYRSRKLSKIYPARGTVIRAIQEGTRLGITGAGWYDVFLAETMRERGVLAIITEDVSDYRKFGFLQARTIEQAAPLL